MSAEHPVIPGLERSECSAGVPCPIPSQNGTFRECSEVGCVVFRAPRSKGAEHGTTTQPTTRKPHLSKHRCGTWALVAIDADTAGLTVWTDPYPLTPAGEVWALTNGRTTYYIHAKQLEPRNAWNIAGRPPGPDRTVLAAHQCGTGIPVQHRAPAPPASTRPVPASKEPPF